MSGNPSPRSHFPNDCRVMSHLMDALGQDPHYPHPKDVCEHRIWLGERVLDESTDSKLREHAAMSLCYTKSCSTDDDRLTALNFGISLLKLLFSDGRFGFYANDLSVFYE